MAKVEDISHASLAIKRTACLVLEENDDYIVKRDHREAAKLDLFCIS